MNGRRTLIEMITRDVAELPDRTSPPDWPEAMLVTPLELFAILDRRLPKEPMNDQQRGKP